MENCLMGKPDDFLSTGDQQNMVVSIDGKLGGKKEKLDRCDSLMDLFNKCHFVIPQICSFLDERSLFNLTRTSKFFFYETLWFLKDATPCLTMKALPDWDAQSLDVFLKSVELNPRNIIQGFRSTFKRPVEENGSTALMCLPAEVRNKLWSFCHQSTLIRLRETCKLLKYEIDSFVGLSIYLDDRKFMWTENIPKFPSVSELQIRHLVKLEPLTRLLSQNPAQLLIRLNLNGSLQQEALFLIFTTCSQLKFLGLGPKLLLPEFIKEASEVIPFRQLKTLDLKIENIVETVLQDGWHWNNAFGFFSPKFFMPTIAYICISSKSNFQHHQSLFEIANAVLTFMETHRMTLKKVEIVLLGSCFSSCQCPLFICQANMKMLEKLELQKFSYDCDWKVCRPFSRILMAQKSLQHIDIFELTDWEFHQNIIQQNCMTLRSVTIQKNLSPLIDLSGFENCTKLEVLRISRNCRILGDEVDTWNIPSDIGSSDSDPIIINFHKLPVNLKELYILDLTASSFDIGTIPNRLKCLHSIQLTFLGRWNRTNGLGLTDEIVTEMLGLSQLKNLFLEECYALPANMNRDLKQWDPKLSKINMFPKNYSVIDKFGYPSLSSILFGLLVTENEKKPSNEFMSQWFFRYSKYCELFKSMPQPTDEEAVGGYDPLRVSERIDQPPPIVANLILDLLASSILDGSDDDDLDLSHL